MATQLNELLEEAVGRATTFADQAAQMQQAASDTAAKVRALGDRVRDESAEAHGLFGDAATKLKEAEGQLSDAEHKADGELSALRTKLDEIEGKLTTLASAAKSGVGELRTATTTITGDLETRQHEIDGLLDAQQQKAEAIETHTGEQLTAMRDALVALQQSVSESQQSLGTAVSAFSQSLAELTQKAQAQTAACVGAVSQAATRAGDALSAAGDHIVQTHNSLMDRVRQKLEEEVPTQAVGALSRIQEAAQELENLCKASDELFPGLIEEVGNKVKDIATLTDQLEQPLAEAARLRQ